MSILRLAFLEFVSHTCVCVCVCVCVRAMPCSYLRVSNCDLWYVCYFETNRIKNIVKKFFLNKIKILHLAFQLELFPPLRFLFVI